jgi:hypothetical protein
MGAHFLEIVGTVVFHYKMTDIEKLNLDDNSFSGTISTGIGKLKKWVIGATTALITRPKWKTPNDCRRRSLPRSVY